MKESFPLDIAMVDDESSLGTLYAMKLRKPIQKGDIRFHFFESANEYLNYLKKTDRAPGAEVLLTDINMPEVSGFELLDKVKQNFPDIDVYMMSAYDDESSIQKSFNLGAKGYFTKPVNYKELQSRIESEYGVSLA